MITMKDAIERSNNGPLMDEKEFEKKLQLTLRRLAGDTGIKLSKEEIIPEPEVGDILFQAGVELAAEVGIYNMDSKRVIQFTREELLRWQALQRDNSNQNISLTRCSFCYYAICCSSKNVLI